jgi:hypothetical protein
MQAGFCEKTRGKKGAEWSYRLKCFSMFSLVKYGVGILLCTQYGNRKGFVESHVLRNWMRFSEMLFPTITDKTMTQILSYSSFKKRSIPKKTIYLIWFWILIRYLSFLIYIFVSGCSQNSLRIQTCYQLWLKLWTVSNDSVRFYRRWTVVDSTVYWIKENNINVLLVSSICLVSQISSRIIHVYMKEAGVSLRGVDFSFHPIYQEVYLFINFWGFLWKLSRGNWIMSMQRWALGHAFGTTREVY